MRIFVSSIDHSGTRRTTRILLHNCTSTSILLRQICKQLAVPRNAAIIKLKAEPFNLIVLDNWPIEHYPIKNGSTFTLELIGSSLRENLELAEPLYKIDEELFTEEQADSSGSPSNSSKIGERSAKQEINKVELKYSNYLQESLVHMLDKVRQGSLQGISEIMREEPPIQDQVELDLLMTKKCSYLLNQLGDCGRNALHWSIHMNKLDLVSFLLIKGANPTIITIDHYTPLQLSVLHHSSEITILLLEQPNFDINQTTKHGSALHLAVRNQDVKSVELLLQNNAELDVVDSDGKYPIDLCQNQKIKKLIQSKAEIGKLAIPNIGKGQIYRVTSTTYRLKQRNLLLNPFKNEFSISNLNGEIEEKYVLSDVDEIEDIRQKSWLMKSSLFYFKILFKTQEKDIIFALKHSNIHKRWISSFKVATKYQEYKLLAKPVASTDQVIEMIDDEKGLTTLHKRKVEDKSPKRMESILNLKSEEELLNSPTNKNKTLRATNEQTESGRASQYEKLKESQIILGSVLQVRKMGSQSTPSSQSDISFQSENSPYKSETSGSKFRKNSQNRVQVVSEFEPTVCRISYVDFEVMKLLGIGAFGKVYLARYKKTGLSYALKVLNKKKLFAKKQLKYAVGEANILKRLNCPFIVKLHFAFQTPTNLYMALDNCSLGDLSELITVCQYLKQSTARFIIAQLVLAIEYLHTLKILYRDLKPENILIASDGYIRLTDFGLSRQNSFAASFCGSPAYLSPEMLQKKGVGLSSDIYGIGCVLYEMMVGEPPFYDDNLQVLFQNIKSGKLRFPSYMSIQIKSLISRLLERDLNKRLGVKDIGEIKKHDFFKKIDWHLLQQKRIKPPQEMFMSGQTQIQQDQIELEVKDGTTLIDHDYNETTKMINRVKNFTFVREQSDCPTHDSKNKKESSYSKLI